MPAGQRVERFAFRWTLSSPGSACSAEHRARGSATKPALNRNPTLNARRIDALTERVLPSYGTVAEIARVREFLHSGCTHGDEQHYTVEPREPLSGTASKREGWCRNPEEKFEQDNFIESNEITNDEDPGHDGHCRHGCAIGVAECSSLFPDSLERQRRSGRHRTNHGLESQLRGCPAGHSTG